MTWASEKRYLGKVPETVSEAVKGIQVSKAKKDSAKVLDAFLIVLVKDTADCFGGMETPALKMVIESIKTSYWFLRVEEIAMVFNRARLGMIKVYGNLTPADMLQWLHDYDTGERLGYCVSENTKHKETSGSYFDQLEVEETRDRTKQLKEAIKREEIYQEAKIKVQAS